ncbi:MAG: helix-turn-helix domain-containing protein, partial [Rhodospirillum sp.]|nr:helix-turn-helix domain-containing protein [Rhodospirillum sp.]MCF8491396.1 helix-turn-helix domain-containing protein [Rhodospirillum sp.]
FMTNALTKFDVPKNPATRREWVKYQFALRGLSFRRLAAKIGVTQQAISACLMAPNFHLEPVVADVLGLTPQDLFPERFDAMGNRLSLIRPTQRNRWRSRSSTTQLNKDPSPDHRQKGESE